MIVRLLLAAALAVPAALAQSEDNAIERTTRACIDAAQTPGAMAECTAKASELWLAETARLVEELARALDAEGRQALRAAQAEWAKFRAAEARSITSIYRAVKSPGSALMSAEDQMELARNRAAELKKYLDLLKESQP